VVTKGKMGKKEDGTVLVRGEKKVKKPHKNGFLPKFGKKYLEKREELPRKGFWKRGIGGESLMCRLSIKVKGGRGRQKAGGRVAIGDKKGGFI